MPGLLARLLYKREGNIMSSVFSPKKPKVVTPPPPPVVEEIQEEARDIRTSPQSRRRRSRGGRGRQGTILSQQTKSLLGE